MLTLQEKLGIMISAAVRSKAMVQCLFIIHCFAPIVCVFYVLGPCFFCVVLSVLSSFVIISLRKIELLLFVFLMTHASSLMCPEIVCSVRLWNFLLILM